MTLPGAIEYTLCLAQSSTTDAVAILGIVLAVSGATYAGVAAVRAEQSDKVRNAISAAINHESHVQEHGEASHQRKNKKHCNAFRRSRYAWSACGWVPIALLILISFGISSHFIIESAITKSTPVIAFWPIYWVVLTVMTIIDMIALIYSFFATSKLLYAVDSMGDLAETVTPHTSTVSKSGETTPKA